MVIGFPVALANAQAMALQIGQPIEPHMCVSVRASLHTPS
jgi:hypothetical protein